MVNTAANSSMPFSTADVLNVNIVDKSSSIPNFFDWAPIVLSIIAIAISIYTIYQTKETHKATLASTFFASIFKEYLLEKFPNGRERICFENGRIKGHEILVDDLNKLRRDILYFKYADNDFYLALKKELQDLGHYRTIRRQRWRMPFLPSASCRNLDLPPVNLRFLQSHLTKNAFAIAPTHLCGIALNQIKPHTTK